LPYIEPELREDKGEIEVAGAGKLPKLVELSDIKGDLHIHTKYDVESSHDIGSNSLSEHVDRARELGYEYLGISDHNPSIAKHSSSQIAAIMKKRKSYYEGHNKGFGVFVMCEVDILPDGKLALPHEAFEYVDAVIVSIHSSFGQDRTTVTQRILHAFEAHPKVRIFGHPTGRMLGSREGVDADWPHVFEAAKKHDIALEVNAYPERLDLPDSLVYDAIKMGLRFVINTDAHAVDHMNLMRYGVSVARRGWATKDDILNSLSYNEFKKWLLK